MNRYENPLCTRYASKKMQYIFSSDNKFTTWRKYIEFIENHLGVKVSLVSVGPERTQNIYRSEF